MPRTAFDLTGRIALVTGSSRGIGYAIAEGLADAGAAIVLNSRNAADLEAAARAPRRDRGDKVHAVSFDVTRPAKRSSARSRRSSATSAPIDILVNNAGIQRRGPIVDATPKTWREVMATNLDAVFFVGQAVGRRMVRARPRQDRQHLLAGQRARAGRPSPPTHVAKAAVKMLTQVDVRRVGRQRHPGERHRSRLLQDRTQPGALRGPGVRRLGEERTPAGRWGEVEELKGAAIFLASDAASFVNGHILYVDGGLLSAI